MSYDLLVPERYIERQTVSLPFGLARMGWEDMLDLARQQAGEEFTPTRFWTVEDEQDADQVGLAFQEGHDTPIVVIDVTEPVLTGVQVDMLKHLHRMSRPPCAID